MKFRTKPFSNLSSCLSADGKREESGFFRVSWHFELGEGSSVSLNGLTDFPLYRVELHVPCHPVLLLATPGEGGEEGEEGEEEEEGEEGEEKNKSV